MNVPVITQLIGLIEEIFKHHLPEAAKAAEQAAAGAALETVEADPKVQAVTAASVALLTAAQSLKTAIDENKATTTSSGAPSSNG